MKTDLFKTLVWDVLVREAINQLTKASILSPILSWGPLNFIFTWVVLKLTDKLYVMVRMFIDVTKIRLKNAAAENAYNLASSSLKVIGINYGEDSEEFEDARLNHQDKLSKLVRFGK